jgi:beta-lactamase class A
LSGWRIPHKTGDFLPNSRNDAAILEAPGRTVVPSIFTANHFGAGDTLEEAIGQVGGQVAGDFGYRQ